MNPDVFRRECGCEVQVAPTGAIIMMKQDCETPVYAEAIVITPCFEHQDHPKGAWRAEADA